MSRVPDPTEPSAPRASGGPESSERAFPTGASSPVASDPSLEKALSGARPYDPVGVEFARERIAAELFGDGDALRIGRFQLNERLGAGGMGVVYAAFDPELDRTVALKLVHVPGLRGASALAEAKALARLSHPNVVPIFDVGMTGEHVYIVMELVPGQTLRNWVRGRSQREILRAYGQAGEALAAAHAAGLVHRDFKPDNAVMGVDGRVRVVDFGLACEANEESVSSGSRAAGTPRYMAPEQTKGLSVTAAADQYSFCLALAEALERKGSSRGPTSTPRWLQAALDRGLMPSPGERYPSMRELLRALAHDPQSLRRRRLTAAFVVVAGATAFVAGRATFASRVAACEQGGARLAAIWAPSDRATALDRIAQFGVYGRSLRPLLERLLGDHATRWANGYRDACLAEVHSTQSNALVDMRMACLERSRRTLSSVAEIVRTTNARSLPTLIPAVHALPDPGDCDDLDSLLAAIAPPPAGIAAPIAVARAKLDSARVQIAGGHVEKARALAGQAVVETRALAYKPLLGEALLVEGTAVMAMEDHTAAIPMLTEAASIAFEVGSYSLAVEAWARRAWTQGTFVEGTGALDGVEVVEAVAARASIAPFARALLYNNIGGVELVLEHRDRARSAFERALREARPVTGPGAVELLNVKANLAMTTDDPTRQVELLSETEAEKARLLGADHPDSIEIRWLRGMMLVRFADAAQVLSSACEGFELHDDERTGQCWSEVGYLRRELGDVAGALLAMQRAASARRTDELAPEVAPYVLLWQGHAAEAIERFTQALGAKPPPHDGEVWLARFQRADLELGRARAYRSAGRWRDATRALSASLPTLSDVASKHPAAAVERRVGRARAELAMTLATAHAGRAEIARAAAPAVEWLRRAGGARSELEGLEQLAASTMGPVP